MSASPIGLVSNIVAKASKFLFEVLVVIFCSISADAFIGNCCELRRGCLVALKAL